MKRPLFEVLGDWTAGTDFTTIPAPAVDVAKQAILDCVGVTLAGTATPLAQVIERYVAAAGSGPASVIGRQQRTTAETAAFANGSVGHALDYDDCTGSLGGHPSVAILPATLAMGESLNASGRDVLTAYVVGFEVAAKLGRAMNFEHYERGWHPTATLGVFGATAAAAKLLGLDATTTATALAITSSVAAGVKANFGTATKPIQVGRAAQNGVFAARLAAMGADANLGSFEHEQGFAELHNGTGGYDPERASSALEAPWDLIDPGLTVKRYPCCSSTHGAADAALQLRDQITGSDAIARIDVWTHPRRLRHTNRPTVSTELEAKFSVQYVVSRAFHTGHVGLGHFSVEAITDPDVTSLMRKVHAQAMPESRWGADHFPAEVAITLHGGRTIHARVERPRGNGPAHALSEAELGRKFQDCCTSVGLAAERTRQIHETVRALDTANLEDLLAPLRDAAAVAGVG